MGAVAAVATPWRQAVIQINIGDHVSRDAGYIALPPRRAATMRWARTRARWIAGHWARVNAFYRALPGGRSLTELLDDRSLWVNYHPTLGDWGETSTGGRWPAEIAISERAFRAGRWQVLATLVHELAHVDGAPDEPSTLAEQAVAVCRLGSFAERVSGVDDPRTPYDPTIQG